MPKNPKYNRGPAYKYLTGKKAINQGNPGIGTFSNKPKGQYAPANLINVNNVGGGAMNVPTYVSVDQAIAHGASVGFKYVIGIPVFCSEENECLETLRSPNADLCGTEGFEGPALIISSNHEVTIGPELYAFGLALVQSSDAKVEQKSLENSLPPLEKERDSVTDDYKQSVNQVADTKSELKDKESDYQSVSESLQTASEELVSLNKALDENKSLQEKLGCAEQAEPNEDCQQAIKEAEGLRNDIASVQASIDEYQRELASLQLEIDALNKLLEVYEARSAELQQQLDSLDNRIQSRQDAVSQLKVAAEELESKAADIRDCVVNYSAVYYNKIGLNEAALEAAMSTIFQTYVTFDQVMQENSEEPK